MLVSQGWLRLTLQRMLSLMLVVERLPAERLPLKKDQLILPPLSCQWQSRDLGHNQFFRKEQRERLLTTCAACG